MKKITVLILSLAFLSGCAPYRIEKGIKKPYDQGYVATREGKVILEYTIGPDNKVSDDIELARVRFRRRRRAVEDYYKKMGIIENRLKENVSDRLGFFWGIVGGVFNMPVRIASEYRYNHNPEYRARVDKRLEEQEARAKARLEELKAELAAYIEEDLRQEQMMQAIQTAAKSS
ncbi:MAG: hypothetical protein QME65_04055 [Candidatus Omnitrophota bacterium]|nr:hypothetical protein [Candidatus Omnitrophota bacterium]